MGREAPRPAPQRCRIGSAVSVVLYALFAWIIAGAVSSLDRFGDHIPEKPVGIWVLTAYFGIGVVVNLISRSRPERFVMTPVAAVLFACCLLIALA